MGRGCVRVRCDDPNYEDLRRSLAQEYPAETIHGDQKDDHLQLLRLPGHRGLAPTPGDDDLALIIKLNP